MCRCLQMSMLVTWFSRHKNWENRILDKRDDKRYQAVPWWENKFMVSSYATTSPVSSLFSLFMTGSHTRTWRLLGLLQCFPGLGFPIHIPTWNIISKSNWFCHRYIESKSLKIDPREVRVSHGCGPLSAFRGLGKKSASYSDLNRTSVPIQHLTRSFGCMTTGQILM